MNHSFLIKLVALIIVSVNYGAGQVSACQTCFIACGTPSFNLNVTRVLLM